MSDQISNKIHFFRECLAADTQAKSLWNIFSSQVQFQAFVDSSHRPPLSPIDLEPLYLAKLEKTLDRYSREKELLLCSDFIITYHETRSVGGKKRLRKTCCPLIYYRCSVIEGKAVLDIESAQINPSAKELLELYSPKTMEKLDQWASSVVETPENYVNGTQELFDVLIKNHNKSFYRKENRDKTGSDKNGSLKKTSAKNALAEITENEIFFARESWLCVVNKQESAQGAQHELQLLSQSSQHSSPLRAIVHEPFDDIEQEPSDSRKPSVKRSDTGNRFIYSDLPLPVVLNDRQKKAIQSSNQNRLSVLMGPPGTGKSYTIASIALDAFLRGESVLVVSQNQHAADVVRQKLLADFGVDQRLTVLGSDKGNSRELIDQLKDLLQSSSSYDDARIKALHNRLSKVLNDQHKTRLWFQEECNKHLGIEQERTRSFYSVLLKLFWTINQRFRPKLDEGEQEPLFNEIYQKVEAKTELSHAITKELVKTGYESIANAVLESTSLRSTLTNLIAMLSAKTEYTQKNYSKKVDYSLVLDALPLWFGSLRNLHRLLPLQHELFDLVIFDEATQCNMASCLPALQRAKRAVVVGDTKQIGHMSFVSFEEQRKLFEHYKLESSALSHDYRTKSLIHYALDAIGSAHQLNTLNEHYRSEPEIIDFSNQHFYDGNLKVMTQRPVRSRQIVKIVHCEGERSANKINKREAEEIIKTLRAIVDEQNELCETLAHDLGVLSFFTAQADYLEQKVFEEFTLHELRKHNIRCGTPFSFQGEEREHMLISCAVDGASKASVYTYLNRDDVFNVAVTRAKSTQTLFLSCSIEEVKASSKLHHYLRHVSQGDEIKSKQLPIRDQFQDQVCLWLETQNVKVYKNYLLAGIAIDIVACHDHEFMAIDLVGFEGDLHGALSLNQFQLLRRAGLKSFLLPHTEWVERRSDVCQAISNQLGFSAQMTGSQDDSMVIAQYEQYYIDNFYLSVSGLYQKLSELEEQGLSYQLILLIKKYQQFEDLISQCFNRTELTYSRYANAFKSLVEKFLINVSRSITIIQVLESQIEMNRLNNAPDALGMSSHVHDESTRFIDEQQSLLRRKYEQNQLALLQMDSTNLKLNELAAIYSQDNMNLDEALEFLKSVTEKLDLYQ